MEKGSPVSESSHKESSKHKRSHSSGSNPNEIVKSKPSPQTDSDPIVKKSAGTSLFSRGFTHRVKQEIAAYVAPPLFKYYMPTEIQQLLELFVYMLSTYGVGEKMGTKMRETIVKALVELFVMFDDGIIPTSNFTDVYQLFRRVCSLIRNTVRSLPFIIL